MLKGTGTMENNDCSSKIFKIKLSYETNSTSEFILKNI
jgi:hypothetical protein